MPCCVSKTSEAHSQRIWVSLHMQCALSSVCVCTCTCTYTDTDLDAVADTDTYIHVAYSCSLMSLARSGLNMQKTILKMHNALRIRRVCHTNVCHINAGFSSVFLFFSSASSLLCLFFLFSSQIYDRTIHHSARRCN